MSGQPWEDRRGMFQRGKEVHEPGRKMSNSGIIAGTGSAIMDNIRRGSNSSTGGSSAIDKALGTESSAPSSPTSQRRRSSAAGKFSNLQQHKRGSEAYEARRASQLEQTGGGGLVSGWFNSTFRGVKQPGQSEQGAGAAEPK